MVEVPCPKCGVGNPERRTKCYRCEVMLDGSVPVPSDSKASRGVLGAANELSRVGDFLIAYVSFPVVGLMLWPPWGLLGGFVVGVAYRGWRKATREG